MAKNQIAGSEKCYKVNSSKTVLVQLKKKRISKDKRMLKMGEVMADAVVCG